jgi:hypothetical protein
MNDKVTVLTHLKITHEVRVFCFSAGAQRQAQPPTKALAEVWWLRAVGGWLVFSIHCSAVNRTNLFSSAALCQKPIELLIHSQVYSKSSSEGGIP